MYGFSCRLAMSSTKLLVTDFIASDSPATLRKYFSSGWEPWFKCSFNVRSSFTFSPQGFLHWVFRCLHLTSSSCAWDRSLKRHCPPYLWNKVTRHAEYDLRRLVGRPEKSWFSTGKLLPWWKYYFHESFEWERNLPRLKLEIVKIIQRTVNTLSFPQTRERAGAIQFLSKSIKTLACLS